jgi:SpoVK/Ycf46/Vps4 family AAA+-type ATPase
VSPNEEAGPSLRAAFEQALARIAALKSAQDISTAAVRGINPLDLSALDPLTPGAFPGIGPAARTAASDHPPAPGESAEPGGDGTADTGTEGADQATATAAATAAEAAKAKAAEPPPKTLTELLAELDDLTGLTDVKAEIHRQVAVLRIEGLRHKAGLKSPTITRHLVFVGNPGTGKTTVARLVGGIYRALGLLSKGQLVEVDRSELVAGYLGQTAIKTAEVVASAAGGVLFIDEAYSLAGDQYGTEAVDTLVKEMEDRRDDLVLIVAGYPEPMAIFITQNPGLASRFRTTIEFDDYTDAELVEIFLGMAKAADYDVTDECLDHYRMILSTTPRGPAFGNGRFARNLMEAAIGRHAWRLRDVAEPTLQQLRELIADDLDDEPAQSEPAPSEPGTTSAEPAPGSPPSPAAEPDQATSAPIPDSEETA